MEMHLKKSLNIHYLILTTIFSRYNINTFNVIFLTINYWISTYFNTFSSLSTVDTDIIIYNTILVTLKQLNKYILQLIILEFKLSQYCM